MDIKKINESVLNLAPGITGEKIQEGLKYKASLDPKDLKVPVPKGVTIGMFWREGALKNGTITHHFTMLKKADDEIRKKIFKAYGFKNPEPTIHGANKFGVVTYKNNGKSIGRYDPTEGELAVFTWKK